MSYLKKFPISELKVDQSFLQGFPANDEDAAIVRAIIALAHSLDLTVTAEGVETKEQEVFLKNSFPKQKWKNHRDGSSSFYSKDNCGNMVEFIKYEKN